VRIFDEAAAFSLFMSRRERVLKEREGARRAVSRERYKYASLFLSLHAFFLLRSSF